MFEQGMPPTLMLLDPLHDLFEDPLHFSAAGCHDTNVFDVQRGLL